jgi:hypothetical protein
MRWRRLARHDNDLPLVSANLKELPIGAVALGIGGLDMTGEIPAIESDDIITLHFDGLCGRLFAQVKRENEGSYVSYAEFA